VRRHNLHAHGEEDILDSVEAACLGVVQNYTVTDVPPWVLFSPQDERLASPDASQPSSMETIVQNAMLMKEVCIKVGEELGNELSEGVWRHVSGREQERRPAPSPPVSPPPAPSSPPPFLSSAVTFCTRLDDSGCVGGTEKSGLVAKGRGQHGEVEHGNAGKKKKKKARHKKEKKDMKKGKTTTMSTKKRGSRTPSSSPGTPYIPSMQEYSDLLQTLDADGSLSNMLLREHNNPGLMLPEDQQRMLRQGKVAMRCDVCRAVVNYVFDVTPGYTLESESSIVSVLEGSCTGPPDTSMPPLLGISPPPLPALWTDRHRISWPKIGDDQDKTNEEDGETSGAKTSAWSLSQVLLPPEPRPTDPREYRQRLSGKAHLEKLILTESCKLAVHGNEDKIATGIVRGERDATCEHVCVPPTLRSRAPAAKGTAGDHLDL
jgi:hypothetical protein